VDCRGKDVDEAVAWAVKAPFKEGHVSEVRKFFELSIWPKSWLQNRRNAEGTG
jgi:hypothetical protein